MKTHVHRLSGCAPTPLAHYLKALGILRLVAEQADATARGWWRDETFWLATTLDREALERFFLHDYRPTPIVAPWNGGSGFYKNWDAKSGKFRQSKAFDALQQIEFSTADRFSNLRGVIAVCRGTINEFARPIDPATTPQAELNSWLIVPPDGQHSPRGIHKKEDKSSFIGRLATNLDTADRVFFDSAVAVVSIAGSKSGSEEIAYPSVWGGTGGTDGKLDFTNNFLRRIAEVFDSRTGLPQTNSPELLQGCLWDTPVHRVDAFQKEADIDTEATIGQFFPGNAGGPNMVAGFAADSGFNIWDFILMLEGVVLLTASVVKRTSGKSRLSAAAPFTTHNESIGYGSAARIDENPRGEQWMPLWQYPAKFEEVHRLFTEGRTQVGKQASSRTIDFAKSLARMGAARGIAAFQRFGYIERNGQANLATPLGRWAVVSKPQQNLLAEVGDWINALARAARDEQASIALQSTYRRCREAELMCIREGGTASWQNLLLALSSAELQITRNPSVVGKNRLYPLPPLSAGWIEAAGGKGSEVSVEFRLAIALAGLSDVEAHWLPLKEGHRREFEVRDEKLAFGHRVVCAGRDLENDCIALLRRRFVELHQGKHPDAKGFLPLRSAPRTGTNAHDIAEFLAGRVDDDKILRLALALMPVQWREVPARANPSPSTEWNSLYCLFRLALLPEPLGLENGQLFTVKPDAAMLNRLAAGGPGDLTRAAEIALRRLRIAGLRPKLREVIGGGISSRRLAASLAFGISSHFPNTASRLAARIIKPADDPVLSAPSESEPAPTQP